MQIKPFSKMLYLYGTIKSASMNSSQWSQYCHIWILWHDKMVGGGVINDATCNSTITCLA